MTHGVVPPREWNGRNHFMPTTMLMQSYLQAATGQRSGAVVTNGPRPLLSCASRLTSSSCSSNGAMAVGPMGRVVGVDLSGQMVDVARRRADVRKVSPGRARPVALR